MEKKIRYLMLLLCLCLFPMKAFALENSLEDTNKEVDNVVADNISYDENQEDLQKIEDPNKVQIEENSNEPAGEEPENEKSFDQSQTSMGVIISVSAPKGVFPPDATLSVKAISNNSKVEKIENAVLSAKSGEAA